MPDEIATLQKWINDSSNIVFFGGAGVSTESGIPDFRSVDGLYNQQYRYPPEQLLSHTFYELHPEEFFRFYRDKMLPKGITPNVTHKRLAELEKAGKLRAVITQNIDGLHQMAGSENVLELHGSVLRNYCENCGKSFSVDYIADSTGIPVCDVCGGRVKPDVVLYEEALSPEVMYEAQKAIAEADLLIVGGTSLVVYPAAGLLNYFGGRHLVLINRDRTAFDHSADLVLHEKLGQVFNQIVT